MENDDDDERHKLQINAKYRKHAQFCASIAHLSHVCVCVCIRLLVSKKMVQAEEKKKYTEKEASKEQCCMKHK